MTHADRILEARRKFKAGEFDQKIVSREAKHVEYDVLTLECGHTVGAAPGRNGWHAVPGGLFKRSKFVRCEKCAEAWSEGGGE